MRSLLAQVLVFAAVVTPSAAFHLGGDHDQTVVDDDAYNRAQSAFERFKQSFPDGAYDAEDLDVLSDDAECMNAGTWSDLEYAEGGFEDEYSEFEWTFPGFGGDHPREPPRGGRPKWPGEPDLHHPFPERPGRPDLGPPFHRQPGSGTSPPHRKFPCPHHRHPHHPVHTNKTIYELLSESKYTTKAFEIVKNDEELTALFNNTKVNLTLFVPTDKAFGELPPHHPPHNSTDSISKELLKKIVLYHTSPDVYDTKKLWLSRTIASSLKSEGGIGKGNNQRLRIGSHLLSGLKINFLSKIIAGNIFATNGVVHGVDHIIILPPYAGELIGILPTVFSTSAYAFTKLELSGVLRLPDGPKTFFIPANSAWRRLGYRINAFLFSRFGEKYLAALMKYHVTHGKLVYSDYVLEPTENVNGGEHYHTELDTYFGDEKLTVDIWRKGPWARWRVNKRVPAFPTDIITRDGVIHVPTHILIPPHKGKKPGHGKPGHGKPGHGKPGHGKPGHGKPGHGKPPQEPFHVLDEEAEFEEVYMGGDGEMTVEELKERLEPYL